MSNNSSNEREDSPDWLRSFQAPTVTLSSDSASPPIPSPSADEYDKIDSQFSDQGNRFAQTSALAPSSNISKDEVPRGGVNTKKKKIKGNWDDGHDIEDDTSEKHINAHVSTSRLPLVLSEKVQRSKALVECEGESIDLSGDVGAVGRVVIPDSPSGDSEMFLDLKGTIYRTTIVPSRTFCIVSFGPSEAKIEAIMNDFIQLKTQSNVYEAETMVEGTLEGFSFDSEDEADKMPKATAHQTDQNDGVEEPTNGKTKRKAEKSSGGARKKGKTTAGKPQPVKKVRKKTQAPKKAKNKK